MFRFVMIALFTFALLSFADENPFAKADSLSAAGNWKDAGKEYQKVLKKNPDNGRGWSRLALCDHMQNNFKDAIPAYEKALDLNFAPGLNHYNLGCAFSRTGNSDKAYEQLEKAFDAGFTGGGDMQGDTDLASLRENPSRWSDFMLKMDKKIHPCAYNEKARELDFWIGDWNVSFTQSGTPVGVNHIANVESGCMLRENWNSNYGQTGTSINYYDPTKEKWIQMWNDMSGGWIHYEGGMKDGAMHLEGESYAPGNPLQKSRMTLIPNNDGSVRQLIESSRDDGATWSVGFDGLYKKINNEG